jgi:hypothetical protein
VNSGLRAHLAKLDSGEHIQELAAAKGFVMPQPGDVTYVKARSSDAKLALQRITEPAGTVAATTTSSVAPTTATSTTTTPTTTTPTTTTPTVPPATTTTAPPATAVAPATTTTQVP